MTRGPVRLAFPGIAVVRRRVAQSIGTHCTSITSLASIREVRDSRAPRGSIKVRVDPEGTWPTDFQERQPCGAIAALPLPFVPQLGHCSIASVGAD